MDLFIDRGFLSVNGIELQDVESISMKTSDGTKYVPTMTRNRRHKGVVKGNRDINVTFSVAVQATLGTPKIEDIDFQNTDVALTFEHGGDRYSLVGGDIVDTDQGAPTVGQEGKKTWNMIFQDIVDQVGNSSLFQFG